MLWFEYPDGIHLVEDGVVELIDLVSSVDVSKHDEFVGSRTNDVDVMGCCVSSKGMLLGEVEGVGATAGHMVFGDH